MKLNPLALSAALALSLPTTQALAGEPETVWLSSLDLSPITQGWGQPQADQAVTIRSLFIDGKKFEGGLGTHTIIGQLQLADPQATNSAQRFDRVRSP